MNSISLSKIQKCLELASEFIKDENTINPIIYNSGNCSTMVGSMKVEKKSDNLRKEAEEKASKLERQEKCAKLIQECLNYIETINKFENNYQNK